MSILIAKKYVYVFCDGSRIIQRRRAEGGGGGEGGFSSRAIVRIPFVYVSCDRKNQVINHIKAFFQIQQNNLSIITRFPIITRIYIYILKQQHHFLMLVGTLCVCEFAMVPGVYILLCPPGRKGKLFFLHIQLHSHQKD